MNANTATLDPSTGEPTGEPTSDVAESRPVAQVTLRRVIRSEAIKFRSVRSTMMTLAIAGVGVAAIGVLVSMLTNGVAVDADGPGALTDPTGNSLFGANLAQLVLGVLGAVLITSEYSTGMIRATLATVPSRLPVLWAKVIVVAAASFATMVVGVGIAFFVGQAFYGGEGPGASIFDPGVARALLGAAVFPTAIAVMGMAFGAVMRQTAAAIGVLFAMLFVVPLIGEGLGGVWQDITSYLPSQAGQAMSAVIPSSIGFAPLTGFAITAAWVIALLGAAAVTLKRRDA